MDKVLLYGAGFGDNLGDDFILKVAGKEITDSGIKPVYIIPSAQNLYFDFDEMEKLSLPIYMSYSGKIKKTAELLKFFFSSKLFCGYKEIIFYGGGYTNQDFGLRNLVNIYLLERKAKRSGIKIVFTGQTVGPCTGVFCKHILKKIYRSADLVYVREEYSKRILDEFKIGNRLVCDDAYLAFPGMANGQSKDTVIFNYKDFNRSREYKYRIFDVYRRIAQRLSSRIVVMPFRSQESSEEYKANLELYNLLKSESSDVEFIVERDFDKLTEEFKSAEMVFGSAYHSIVLGKMSGAKVCSMYYDEYYKMKIDGFLSLFGGKKYCYPVWEFVGLTDAAIDGIIAEPLKENAFSENQRAYKRVKQEWKEVLK